MTMNSEVDMSKIKIGILGYGNLGKGVEKAVTSSNDMELIGIFTRRNPTEIKPKSLVSVYSVDDLSKFKDQIDVLMLFGILL